LPAAPVVATSAFSEQYILSEVIKGRLEQAGFRADQRFGVGGAIRFLALRHNQIDCSVTYTGDVWTTVMRRKDLPVDRQRALEETRRFLREQYGAVCLGTLGFENTYALAMPRKRAESLGIRTVADLAPHAGKLTIGADMEFFHRPEWGRVQSAYDLHFQAERPMNSSLLYAVVAQGAVDVICAYSTDGRILEKDLVLLEDPRHAFPPYDALLVLSGRAASDPKLVEALRPLVDSIDMPTMQKANLRVDVEGRSPRDAATELLRTVTPARR
jgi:osmoprotectant transport system permease protein